MNRITLCGSAVKPYVTPYAEDGQLFAWYHYDGGQGRVSREKFPTADQAINAAQRVAQALGVRYVAASWTSSQGVRNV